MYKVFLAFISNLDSIKTLLWFYKLFLLDFHPRQVNFVRAIAINIESVIQFLLRYVILFQLEYQQGGGEQGRIQVDTEARAFSNQ